MPTAFVGSILVEALDRIGETRVEALLIPNLSSGWAQLDGGIPKHDAGDTLNCIECVCDGTFIVRRRCAVKVQQGTLELTVWALEVGTTEQGPSLLDSLLAALAPRITD